MVDAIDLTLFDRLEQIGVQSLRRREVAAKWFFVDKPPPIAALFLAKPVLYYLLRYVRKQVRRRREIIEIVVGNLMLSRDFADEVFEVAEKLFVVVKIAAGVINTLRKPFDQLFLRPAGDKLFKVRKHLLTKLLSRHLLTPDADDGKFVRQKIVLGKIIKRGKQLAFGQITRRAKDHHHARVRSFL